MSFKQRVGNFLLLFGVIGLLIFAASVLAPSGNYDVPAFLVGALLFGLGLNFRLSKAAHPPHEAHAAAPAPKAAAKPAGRSGPPKGAPAGGPPKLGAGGPPKRQGLLSAIIKGPPPKKTAPAPPKPGGGGGGPPRKK